MNVCGIYKYICVVIISIISFFLFSFFFLSLYQDVCLVYNIKFRVLFFFIYNKEKKKFKGETNKLVPVFSNEYVL